MTGIYKIVNIITGKVYVGSAININRRWSTHRMKLKENKHHSIKLQNSVNKHGINNFIFEVIEECYQNIMIEREQYWIDSLDSYNNGYNSNPKAGSSLGRTPWNKGLKGVHKMSEETKQKMSEAKKGKQKTEETKQKMSEAMKGNKHGVGNKGKERTDDQKKIISMNKKGHTYNLGRKHSEETKKKISDKLKSLY